jgi:hypothetical protein
MRELYESIYKSLTYITGIPSKVSAANAIFAAEIRSVQPPREEDNTWIEPYFFVTDRAGRIPLSTLRGELSSYTGDPHDWDEITRLYVIQWGKQVDMTPASVEEGADSGPFYLIEDREFKTSIRVIRQELRDAMQDDFNVWPRAIAVQKYQEISGKSVEPA